MRWSEFEASKIQLILKRFTVKLNKYIHDIKTKTREKSLTAVNSDIAKALLIVCKLSYYFFYR